MLRFLGWTQPGAFYETEEPATIPVLFCDSLWLGTQDFFIVRRVGAGEQL